MVYVLIVTEELPEWEDSKSIGTPTHTNTFFSRNLVAKVLTIRILN
jgi:hypothetical protein